MKEEKQFILCAVSSDGGLFRFGYKYYVMIEQISMNSVVEIPITVERQPNSGTFGTVRVDYKTLTAVQTFNHLPAGVGRASDTDFVFTNNSVIFEPGVTSQRFNVTVMDDSTPEVDESVFVILTGTTLLGTAQLREGMRSLSSAQVPCGIHMCDRNSKCGFISFKNSRRKI